MKKSYKLNLVVAGASLLTVGLAGSAMAFHSGGVAECAGCHSMHTSKPNGKFLLVGTDQSSTCLSCHEHAGDTGPSSYHISTAEGDMTGKAPLQRTPGGDFGWLKKTYNWTIRGTANTEAGERHGHNIVAVDKGYAADATNTLSPGGSFSAADLQCNSCHDPHGKYRRTDTGAIVTTGAPIIGNGSYTTSTVPVAGQAVGAYRLLPGSGYTSSTGTTAFPGSPAAVAPSTYNQTEATNQVRVAYGAKQGSGLATWGQWCSTCHADMHTSSGKLVHPVDQNISSATLALYNSYVKSGDMTADQTTSYLSLVPFAQGAATSDFAGLSANASNNKVTSAGPETGAQVTCLSCHRAHASGFPEMLRWNNEYEFIVTNGNYLGSNTMGRNEADWSAAYYDRPTSKFATYQRGLCNKCHAKD